MVTFESPVEDDSVTSIIPISEKPKKDEKSLVPESLRHSLRHPGVIETFGKGNSLKVLTSRVIVLFECLEDIKALPEYQKALQTYENNKVSTLGPDTSSLDVDFQDKLIKYVVSWKPDRYLTSKESNTPPPPIEDAEVMRLAGKLARVMEARAPLAEFTDPIYKTIYDRHITLSRTFQGARVYEGSTLGINVTEKAVPVIETYEQAERTISEPNLKAVIEQHGEYLQEQQVQPHKNLTRAKESQRVGNFAENNILGRLEKLSFELEPTDLPTILLLPGVGQTQENWESRIKFYESKGIKCKYIEWPRFTEGENFESQADWLYEQVKDLGTVAIEAHSKGTLNAALFMHKYPEMVSHAIMTGSPTRSNADSYPGPLVGVLKWGIKNVPMMDALIQNVKALEFFKRTGDWESAFRVYLEHIGEKGKSMWEDIMVETTWTIPKFYLHGAKDGPVNMVGMGAIRRARGAVLAVNPIGDHDQIGDDDVALEVHKRLYSQAQERKKAIVTELVEHEF